MKPKHGSKMSPIREVPDAFIGLFLFFVNFISLYFYASLTTKSVMAVKVISLQVSH